VDFEDPQIVNKASEIISHYPGDYNIYQVLAIFDFMLDELVYISDPDGRDYWATCTETLDREGGDCEDFSILFSSLIGAIGGTTRIYLTKTHAFPALYVGDLAQKNSVLDAIREYYGTEPRFVIFQEDGDHWLVSDPAGSLYMGGLPADAQPAYISEGPLSLGFNFDETEKIHAIDITG
jgi:transglutaminase-like putative cysteine protease